MFGWNTACPVVGYCFHHECVRRAWSKETMEWTELERRRDNSEGRLLHCLYAVQVLNVNLSAFNIQYVPLSWPLDKYFHH